MGARRNSLISKSWLQERKEILKKIKDQVRLYLGAESSDIARYGAAYKKDLSRPWKPSDWSEVFVAIEQSTVVFGGDFHPFAQAQRAHLRILRKLVQERPVVLALECVFQSDQPYVDQFLKGEIEEKVFLDKVQWNALWGFPWKHYRPLFEFAKKHKVPVIALNVEVDERTGQTLISRDQLAADTLKAAIESDPDALFYVLYGDLHIASDHLPRILNEHFKHSQTVETTSIYLNSETIYFELAEKKLESQVEVVRFNDREFCVLSSPPWVKWHSYLMFLEENFDVGLEFEDEDDEDDFDEWELQVDHTDHVSDLIKMIKAAIEVEADPNAIEVYSMDDPQADVGARNSLTPEEHEMAKSMIQGDRSFYIPKSGYMYLSKATVNHAATLAGQYIHAVLSGRNKMGWDFPKDFIASIWIEAMSFLLSKFVNPKRKAQTMTDLKKQLEAFDKEDRGREPLLLALDQKMIELLTIYAKQERAKVYLPREKSSYAFAAKFIGEILGDRYFVLYEKQILDIDNIRDLLRQDLFVKDFESFYFQQLRSLDNLELKGSSLS